MPTPTLDEYLEINSVILASNAFEVTDLSPIWGVGPNRGSDRLIPFADGQLPLVRRRDEWHVDPIKLLIYGFELYDGTPSSDARMTLRHNLDYLITNVFTPNPSAPGTWPLALHVKSAVYSGDCFVQMVGPTAFSPAILQCVLDIIIPSGVLVGGGS
jgi:hypothetical protein